VTGRRGETPGCGAPTLLVEPAQLDGEALRVEGERYRHLFRARRLAAGERLRVVDGAGRARWAEVARVERTAAALGLDGPAPSNEPLLHLELFVAVFRPERAAWLVEKATEVGVAAIRFLHTDRAPRTFGPGTLERLRRVAAAAVEQCGRALLPEVSGVHEWSELSRLAASCERRWFLDIQAAGGTEVATASPTSPCPAALLAGPEGGWTEAERETAQALGFTPLGLGPRTLRVETAALVAAAWTVLAFERTLIAPLPTQT
jgi:16S rRNA (uracil1498-N3)-methyltransferase